MASLFSLIDFRTNDFSQCGGSSLNGAIDTAQAHSETHSCKFTAAGYRETPTGWNKTTVYLQCWIFLTSLPTTGRDFLGSANSSDSSIIELQINTSGKIVLRNATTGTNLGTGTATLATSVWTMLELKTVIHASAGIAECRVNGVVDQTYTGLATNARGNVDRGYWGPSAGDPGVASWFDDIRGDDAGYPPIPAAAVYYRFLGGGVI